MKVNMSDAIQEAMQREAEMDRRRASIGTQKYQGVRKMLAQGLSDSDIMHIADISIDTLINWKRQIREEKDKDMARYQKSKMDEAREHLRAGEDPWVIAKDTGIKLSALERAKDLMAEADETAVAARVEGVTAPPQEPEAKGGEEPKPEAAQCAADDLTQENRTAAVSSPEDAAPVGDAPAPIRRCRLCGCTEDCACPGGCHWVETDLCSVCADEGAPPVLYYTDTYRAIAVGDRVYTNLPKDGAEQFFTTPDDEEFFSSPYVVHSGPVVRLGRNVVWIDDEGRELGFAPEHLEPIQDIRPVEPAPEAAGHESHGDDLPFVTTGGEPTQTSPAVPALSRHTPVWNAHYCDDLPEYCLIIRDEYGEAYLLTESRQIGPIYYCLGCGENLSG